MDQTVLEPQPVVEPPQEATFEHVLGDGTHILVGLPRGVVRLKLRSLLGETYYKEEDLKTMGTAFLSIRKWLGGPPSPLMNPVQFEAMVSRFTNDEDLDEFMEKWQSLTQPELSKIVKTALAEALEQGMDPEETQKYIQQATLPYAKKRLSKLQDSLTTPSS